MCELGQECAPGLIAQRTENVIQVSFVLCVSMLNS